MSTPTYYDNICEKALNVKEKYGLTDIQTHLYNHICRGDFYFMDDGATDFYVENYRALNIKGRVREWIKKQFKTLIKDGLVVLEIKKVGKYTHWYFYCPDFKLDSLINANCFATTHKLCLIKYHFNLEDGFDKNKKYPNIEFQTNFYRFNIPNTEHKGCHPFNFSELCHSLWDCMVKLGYQYKSNIPGYTNQKNII